MRTKSKFIPIVFHFLFKEMFDSCVFTLWQTKESNLKWRARGCSNKFSGDFVLVLHFVPETAGLAATVLHRINFKRSLWRRAQSVAYYAPLTVHRSNACDARKDLETMIYAYRHVHPLPNQSAASVAGIGQGRRTVSQFCRATTRRSAYLWTSIENAPPFLTKI